MSLGLIIIGIALAIILVLLWKFVGKYPEPLPSIKEKKEEIRDVMVILIPLLWVCTYYNHPKFRQIEISYPSSILIQFP